MIELDPEIKSLAALSLRNAFWHDFSGLVNTYLQAAEGLDASWQDIQMGELTSIYGRDMDAEIDLSLNIWTLCGSPFNTPNHETLFEALAHEPATEVWLRGEKVFEKREGEWFYVEECEVE